MNRFIGATLDRTRHAQRGSVLLIVIVLLLLATVLSAFALGVGALEQQASANDVRTRLVQQVADAALAQGAENILANTDMLELDADWEQCAADDTSFPCGSVPQLTEDGAARRATMFRYVGGAFDVFGDGAVDDMDERMLPLDRRITTVNESSSGTGDGFAVQYGVGALLCRLVPSAVGTPATCSTNAGEAVSVNALTLVAVAAIPGESARTTVVKSFATNSAFPLGVNQPPIMASGAIELRGNLQVVTSPNAGGPGVPVSVWTRRPLDAGGTPDTCYADEFYRSGAPTWYPPDAESEDQILRCDDCDCGLGQLTGGHGNSCFGGMDVLANPSDCGSNEPVRPEEFPCDLFAHVFGVQAWSDQNDDHFCETKVLVDDPENAGQQIGADEEYLAEKADWIITDTADGTFGARFAGDPRVIACDDLTDKSGLVWVRTGECGDGKTLGSPTEPMLLVHDGDPSFQNLTLFGLLFVRSDGAGPLDFDAGGDATFRMNAGSAVYGAVIVHGEGEKINGTAAVIYDGKVLANLVSDLSDPDVLGLPGSWTDTVRY